MYALKLLEIFMILTTFERWRSLPEDSEQLVNFFGYMDFVEDSLGSGFALDLSLSLLPIISSIYLSHFSYGSYDLP